MCSLSVAAKGLSLSRVQSFSQTKQKEKEEGREKQREKEREQTNKKGDLEKKKHVSGDDVSSLFRLFTEEKIRDTSSIPYFLFLEKFGKEMATNFLSREKEKEKEKEFSNNRGRVRVSHHIIGIIRKYNKFHKIFLFRGI